MINEFKYTQLMRYEHDFTTAVKSNYAHITRSDFLKLCNIFYDNQAEQFVSKSAFNCPKCKLKELKRIGQEYFKFKENIKDKNNNN